MKKSKSYLFIFLISWCKALAICIVMLDFTESISIEIEAKFNF